MSTTPPQKQVSSSSRSPQITIALIGAIATIAAAIITVVLTAVLTRPPEPPPIPTLELATATAQSLPTTPPDTQTAVIIQSPPTPTPIPPTPTTPPQMSSLVPEVLVGHWVGGGSQYAGDNYYMSAEVIFTAQGEYAKLIGGTIKYQGYFEVNGSYIIFRPVGGQPYTWGWDIKKFSGRDVLYLYNTGGGTYSLDKV